MRGEAGESHGRLHPADIEAIVEKLASRLAGEEVVQRRPRFVDARELAAELGMSRKWVYANAEALGAERRGNGERPRLRFDVERARSALTRARPKSPPDTASPRPSRPYATRRAEPRTASAPLLPVR